MSETVRFTLIALSFIFVTVAAYYRIQSQRSGESLDRTKEGWPILIGVRLAGLLTIGFTVACLYNPRGFEAVMVPTPEAVRWVGVAGFACSVVFLLWMFHTLGRNLTDTVITRRDAIFVTHGPYRFIRNPMYTGVLMLGLSLGLALGTWLVPISTALMFTLLALRTKTEEKYLIERFGDQYREYMTRVGRFVPKREAFMSVVIVFLGLAIVATAQEDHSGHHNAVAGLGTVNLSTSCNTAAQTLISRGAALLHSFGYEEARLAFSGAAKADPTCSMAHWGIARTWYHPIWAPPSPDELKQGAAALERAVATGAKTERERDYINSLAVFYKDWETVDHSTRAKAYEQALAKLSERYPGDDEAAIFHALQLVAIGYLDPTDKTYKWQKQGAQILNQLLSRHRNHPGVAHYIIHSVDYPSTAELGLQAARAYAKIAPDSSHALHMPSHIFTRLGLWDDSIISNTAAAQSGIAEAQRLHGGGGSYNALHATDYLVYAYLQQAKDASAQKVLTELTTITKLDENQFAAAYAFAAAPARWALERHDWKAAAALPLQPAWFPWNRFRNVEALSYYARAIGAARVGDAPAARRAAEQISAIRDALPATRDYDWAGSIGAQLEAARALAAFAEGHKDEGLRLLRTAADHEDAVDKHPVTPGALLPVREILADLLLETGEPQQALKEYQSVLKVSPRRFNATAGAAKAAAKTGDGTQARAYTHQLLEIAKGADSPRPDLLWARNYQ